MRNFILKNENAIYYECGYSCDNVIFLQLGNDKIFITDARYTIEAKAATKGTLVIQSSNIIEETIKILNKNKVKKIIYDANDFSYALYLKIASKVKTEFKNKEKFSQLKRMIKSDEEILLLKKAAKIGLEGFTQLAKYIRSKGENKDERALYFKAYEKMTQKALYNTSFAPIIGINANAAKPHALPTKTKLQKGDLLLVDAGIKYKRYCSDRTSTSHVDFENFNFGRDQKFTKKKHQKIYDIVLKAQRNAISKIRVGDKASDVDNYTRSVITKAGYGKQYIHSTGHGVGLDIHEFPFIHGSSEIIIEENMVFTIEPGIYFPGEFGVRIEDTVCIENGRAVII